MSGWADWLRDTVAPWLREWLAPLDAWLAAQPPWVWHLSAVSLILLGSCWVLLVPRRVVYQDAPDKRAWRDLRLWAVVIAAPYALLYWFFR